MSAWLSVPAALYVVNCIGRDRWSKHNQELLREATNLLHRAFGTECVLGELPAILEIVGIAHQHDLAHFAIDCTKVWIRNIAAGIHLCMEKDLDSL
jgi:hypothetical protein